MSPFLAFAQAAEAVPSPGVLVTAVVTFAGGVSAVYGWFRSELNDCKKDRAELFAKVDKLHETVSNLSLRVGQVERQK